VAYKKKPFLTLSSSKLFLLTLLALLLLVIGFYIGKNAQIELAEPDFASKKSDCSFYGFGQKEKYLPRYVVKRGDSLLSIAKNQLNDSSRVNEIIEMNKETYPSLSLENPFIEVGWELYLPPENTDKTNGLIFVVNGNVSISKQGWGVGWKNSGVGPFPLSDLSTKAESEQISQGDCVAVIYQGRDFRRGIPAEVFAIYKQ